MNLAGSFRRGIVGAALGCAAAACAAVAPAAAAPGDKQFTSLVDHNPSAFLKALRAGADFVKGGGNRRFRIILASGGVVVAIPGTSTVQREYMRIRRDPGLEIVACKETIDGLSKANRRRIPVLPGVSVQKCEGMRNKLTLQAWQPAPGL